MIVIYVALMVIFFLIVLLCFPIYINIHYDKSAEISLRYLFFSFKCNQSNSYIKENDLQENINSDGIIKKNKAQSQKKEKGKLANVLKKYSKKQLMAIAKYTYKQVKSPIANILKHIKINKFYFYAGIAGEDAADCANKTGLISAVSYPLFAIFLNKCTVLKSYKFKLEPLFLANESHIYFDTKIKIPIFFLLISSIRLIFTLAKIYRRL